MKTNFGPPSVASVRAGDSFDHTSEPVGDGDHSRTATVNVAGIRIANLTEVEAIAQIERMVSAGGSHYMVVVNASKTVLARRDQHLRQIISAADLVTADGMSVVLGSRLVGEPLRERVTGIDLFERLVERAARRGLSVYLLGASEPSLRGVIDRLTSRLPALRIAGSRNGYFDAADSPAMAGEIRRSGADLLFVAMGTPAQEYWIAANLAATGVKFALGVGGAFDHLSGLARRAPRWMQRCGLEWLHRLVCEPRRLWRRYLIGNTVFAWLLLRQIVRGENVRPDC